MPYTEETLRELEKKYTEVTLGLTRLVQSLLGAVSSSLKNELAKEYLDQGVCRRLFVMERCIHTIFNIFPPNRTKVLERDELYDVQINLHAFVINLFGVLDNFAWVYVHEYEIEKAVGGRKGVGLFIGATQRHLPQALREYLTMESTKAWYSTYVKNYRDALAHRIPLYVPPFILTKEDSERWNKLDAQIEQCIQDHEFDLLKELEKERDALRVVCDKFLHSYSEAESKPIYIHPQLLSDGATIIELGSVYVKYFRADA